MTQLFPASADRLLRRVAWGVLALTAAALAGGLLYARSDGRWGVGTPQPQPLVFRHDLHAGALKVACRYCHVGATSAAAAAMPSTQTCLTCHSQIWRGTPQLAPLHAAAVGGRPIAWRSVSRLPDHVRFHHGAHAAAGVGCATCHGPVETMAQTAKTESLSMGWCVDCHRDAAARGARPIRAPGAPRSHADGRDITDCVVCHH